MLVLRTFMDRDGFAYPSLRTWSAACRMSVNTLRKHVLTAAASGWLHVTERREGQAWKQHVYRCSVPDSVTLSDKDEAISDALAASNGELDESEAVSLHADTRSRSNGAQAVSPRLIHVDREDSLKSREAVSTGTADVYQTDPEAVSKIGRRVSKSAEAVSPRVTLKSSPEVLEVLREANPEREAQSHSRSSELADGHFGNGSKATESERKTKRKLSPEPLPETFELTTQRRSYAIELGVDVESSFRKFKLYYRGDGKPKQDWGAQWHLWCTREAERKPKQRVRCPTTAELYEREIKSS